MTLQGSAQAQLKQFVEQIERLEQDKRDVASDIKDKYLELKSQGFDTKAVKQVVKLRRKSATERQEEEGILDVYLHALGMVDQGLVDDEEAA